MQTASLAALSADISSIAKQAAQSSVAIRYRGHSLSGFYWREDVIVSASEPIPARPGETVTVMVAASQKPADAVLIGRDPATDVALLRVEEKARPVAAASGAELSVGAAVVAAGRSRHGASCAVGFVALAGAPWRSMRGADMGQRVWLDIRLPYQLEGGAVFGSNGEYLGMAVHAPRRRVLLIPGPTIERVGQELLVHGRVRRAYLGVGVHAVAVGKSSEDDGGEERTGLMIISLDRNGPAAQAGMQQGDIILGFDGTPATSARALLSFLRSAGPGKGIDLDILRSGREIRVNVILGEGRSP